MSAIIRNTRKNFFDRNVPILTFLSRTWMLLAFTLLANYATLWNHAFLWAQNEDGSWRGLTLFDICGAVLYVPALSSVAVFVALLIIHLFFRDTLDRDAHDGTYISDWRRLTSLERVAISSFLRIGIIIAIAIIAASMAHGGGIPDQKSRWERATINPAYSIALDRMVSLYSRLEPRYKAIEGMRENGVPAPIVFCLHQRESSGDFSCHPHEGSPLQHRTRYVPKGRLPAPDPPYTFNQSAEDAYYVVDRLDRINWTSIQDALQGVESFNGLGYQKYHSDVPSPYVCAATSLYSRGKYTGDGRFDRMAVDKQLGVIAILKRLAEHGIILAWK